MSAPGIASTPPLALASAFGLIKDYDAHITAMWNLFIVVIAAMVTALTAKQGRFPPHILLFGFLLFAAGHVYSMTVAFEQKRHMIEYARKLIPGGDPSLTQVLDAFTPTSLPILWMLHLLLDLFVTLLIVLYPRSQRQLTSSPE